MQLRVCKKIIILDLIKKIAGFLMCLLAWEEKQLENDNHFMFIVALTMAMFALLIGDVNSRAIAERTQRQKHNISQQTKQQQPENQKASGREAAKTSSPCLN